MLEALSVFGLCVGYLLLLMRINKIEKEQDIVRKQMDALYKFMTIQQTVNEQQANVNKRQAKVSEEIYGVVKDDLNG